MSRTVLITGGRRGIGLALARSFQAQGHRVAVTYRSSEPSADLFAVRCDVRDADSIESAFTQVEAEYGAVEVLVANAGITDDAVLIQQTDSSFTQVLDTNLVGAYRVARRAVPRMLRARWGRLVFISSVTGFSGARGQSNYAASKAGLIGLSRSLALELGPHGITSNVVALGYVETDMTATLTDQRRQQLLGRIALGRPARPEETTGIVRWLSGDEADYVTGAILTVDGGLGMGH
ncbi:beta-ketoacyl-ACP reductase [Streptomyces avidinii]